MKGIGTYSGYVAFFILGWLMSSQCDRKPCPPCPQIVEHRVDTLHMRSVDTIRETVVKAVPYVEYRDIIRRDTIEKPIGSDAVHLGIVEYYQDSAYRVETNLLYEGKILGADQQFSRLKDDFFTIEIRDTFLVKEEKVLKSPPSRILSIGPLVQGNQALLSGIGVSASYMDRKHRSLEVGYLFNQNVWQTSLKIPIWYL
jgi:hypothetical protein